MTFCEEDLHAIVQMGFGQTENRKTPTQSPSFNGNIQNIMFFIWPNKVSILMILIF